MPTSDRDWREGAGGREDVHRDGPSESRREGRGAHDDGALEDDAGACDEGARDEGALDGARRSLNEVRARLSTVVPELERVATSTLRAREPRDTVVTGIGGSEGPARLFASLAGASVRFVPLSSFVAGRPIADRLVVFSQGLSPNARLALARRTDFAETIVVGAVDPLGRRGQPPTDPTREGDFERRVFARALQDDGVELVTHGPNEESGMLVRLVGPTVASAMAVRLAASVGGSEGFDAAGAARAYATVLRSIETSGSSPVALDAPLAFVAAGELVDALFGLRWKWLETFGADPHVFDVLACAHGPLQALYERPATWLAFESARSSELFDRLARVLPAGHVLRRVSVSDEVALAFFEATAHLDATLLATLAGRPRDLRRWPGRGADGALYDLGR